MHRYIAFCKIVELGSFTRAAEALGYTQAAVSQIVRSLENEFKLNLIIRMRTGIKLTPEGEILYPLLLQTVTDNRQILDKVKELRGLESGEIRIGTFSSVSQNLLPKLIKKFSLEYPGVKFTLRQGDIVSICDMIRTGMIDFGFVYPNLAKGLSTVPLVRDIFLAVLPEEHSLAGKSVLTLSDLANESLIALDEGNMNSAENAFHAAGINPRIKYLIYDDYTILAMIEEGLGIGVLPAAILKHTNYRFNAIPISPSISRTIGIAYQSDRLLPIAAHRFIDFMKVHISECTAGNFSVITNEE